jgi:hypothetical protein
MMVAIPDLAPNTPLDLGDTLKIIPCMFRDLRQTAAPSGLQLPTRANRALCVLPAQVAFPLIFEVPPAGFEPATHGLGNRCSIP